MALKISKGGDSLSRKELPTSVTCYQPGAAGPLFCSKLLNEGAGSAALGYVAGGAEGR
ncbi:MAG TPA: hypothetical protein VGO47_08630 [Chlamydiales bacterium]|nr:hypothetical protein [Chlamydiales bacterium]